LKHYRENGLTPCEKKSGGRANNKRSIQFEAIKYVCDFLKISSEKHALVLPGRVPGYKATDICLLPSSETKEKVYKEYCASLALLEKGNIS
jgi:hypothetical protein